MNEFKINIQIFWKWLQTWLSFILWTTSHILFLLLKSTTCPLCSNRGAPVKYRETPLLSPTDTENPTRVLVGQRNLINIHFTPGIINSKKDIRHSDLQIQSYKNSFYEVDHELTHVRVHLHILIQNLLFLLTSFFLKRTTPAVWSHRTQNQGILSAGKSKLWAIVINHVSGVSL